MASYTYTLTKVLGNGSYGIVYEAKLQDGTKCAAKKLRGTVGHQNIKNFNKECDTLRRLNHQNIVRYLGKAYEQQVPVLFMELLNDSLTAFLRNTSQAIPYHLEVNICCDIAAALSYLHYRHIAHRDLSSNNVLLTDKLCAKISDFGMSKILQITGPHTRRPGTEAYMPPEALQPNPIYNVTIDCYSLGVLILQILTKTLPDTQKYTIDVLQGKIAVPYNYMQKAIGHPLQPIAYECLRTIRAYSQRQRPQAQEIHNKVKKLRLNFEYKQSTELERLKEQDKYQKETIAQKDAEIKGLKEYTRQLETELTAKTQENEQLQGHIQYLQSAQHLQTSQLDMTSTFTQNQTHSCVTQQVQVHVREINAPLKWSIISSEGSPEISRSCNAVPSNTIPVVYLRESRGQKIYAYNYSSNHWSEIATSEPESCSIVLIENKLTTIGGYIKRKATNKLLTLTYKSKWEEKFEPMPTERARAGSVCDEHKLVVAGGEIKEGTSRKALTMVEVMDLNTKQWSAVADLIQPFLSASLKICSNHLYILGGWCGDYSITTPNVLSCSLTDLYQSKASDSVWRALKSLPVTESTCTDFNGHLLAIGGADEPKRAVSSAVYLYNTQTNEWEQISQLNVPRKLCFAIPLPNDTLLVVGGHTTTGGINDKTNIMEIGSIS